MALIVTKRERESVDQMIRRFKNKFKESGLAKDFFEKQFYNKPSEVKKEKKRLAAYRRRKASEEEDF
jgi:small subunit ribosomal protein S21